LTKDELAPLAKTNIESLAEFDYFTYAKAAKQNIEFAAPVGYSLEQGEDKRVVLRFTLPLKIPASAAKAFSFQVYDPTYFVAFEMEKDNPVGMDGAPKGCSINILGSKPLAADETKKLSESFFSGLSPGTDFGSNSRAGLLSLVREALLNPILESLAVVLRRARLALAGRAKGCCSCCRSCLLGLAVLLPFQCLGQGAHHPFAVGANEGAVSSAQGVSGWILAQESGFYRLLSGAIHAAKQSGTATWGSWL